MAKEPKAVALYSCDLKKQRDYELGRGLPLVGLLNNLWKPPYILDVPHSHNCMEIGVCLRGKGRISVGRSAWTFKDGSVVVVPPGMEHTQKNEGEDLTHWHYVLLNVNACLHDYPSRRRPMLQVMFDRTRPGAYLEGDVCRELCQTIESMFAVYERSGSIEEGELDALVYLLLNQLCRIPRDTPESVSASSEYQRAIEPSLQYVTVHFAEEIRVADMAQCCAMSEGYYRKVFERIMGMAPLEYVNRYRISCSMHLLYSTDETVQAIASRTGFASLATYNRNFLKYVGVTPVYWRKNAHY